MPTRNDPISLSLLWQLMESVFMYSMSSSFKVNELEKRSPRPLSGAEVANEQKAQLNQKVVWLGQNWDSSLDDRFVGEGEMRENSSRLGYDWLSAYFR